MRAILIAALLAYAPVAIASPCDFHCKVRITAAQGGKTMTDDVLPDETAGLCAMSLMGVTTEWALHHPKWAFKSAECVPPDDHQI